MKNLIFPLLLTIFSCTSNNVKESLRIPATLYQIYDDYPKGYIDSMYHLDYDRYVCMTFCVKNIAGKGVFFPLREKGSNIYTSAIELYYNGSAILAESKKRAYFKKDTLLSNDSTIFDIFIDKKQLKKLGIKDNIPIESICQNLRFKYKHTMSDQSKSELPICDIDFKLNKNIKFYYREWENTSIEYDFGR